MTRQDIPAGIRLKELAGWNQTAADWNYFLAASPEGCFVAEVDGHVRGTATTISFENRFAWIGMVLVDPEFRSQCFGTKLLERTIEYLDQQKMPTMKLDATPQGKPLYEKLGFVTEYGIERWILKRPPRNWPPFLVGIGTFSARIVVSCWAHSKRNRHILRWGFGATLSFKDTRLAEAARSPIILVPGPRKILSLRTAYSMNS
jgi:GNAT superfamily N-acetyltransferase